MIRTFLLAMTVALTLGGCGSGKSIPDLGSILVSGVQNPIGRNEVAAIVSSYDALLVGVRAYMRLRVCKTGETFFSNGCSEPAKRSEIKAAVLRSQSLRRELNDFVAKNDRVNAINAYNEFSRILDILRTVPTKAGG